MKTLLIAFIIVIVGTIAASAHHAPEIAAYSGEYDGEWSFVINYDDPECMGTKTVFKVVIKNGNLSGTYIHRTIGGSFQMKGDVKSNGQMFDAYAVGLDLAYFEGTIENGGTWKFKSFPCTGTWSASR